MISLFLWDYDPIYILSLISQILSFLDTRILYLRCSADGGHAIDELGPEKNVGVVEHTVFERDDNELKRRKHMHC